MFLQTRMKQVLSLTTRNIQHQFRFRGRGQLEAELPPEFKNHQNFDRNAEFPNPLETFVKPSKKYFVGGWLLLSAGGVYFMIILGGYTRLTHSGLSMTRWRPIEYSYPRTEEQWSLEYQHYKEFPEYKHNPEQQTLQRFKKIYAVEYLHRISGSSLGAIYLLPLLLFRQLGWITPKFTKRLSAIGGLGLLQGLIGWWMVKSGLQQPKPIYQITPRVSTYRLIVHLSMAVSIYSLLLWNAMSVLRKPQHLIINPENYRGTRKVRIISMALVHLVAINILSGACMAGIDAGKVYNTWPLMNGQVVPQGIFKLDSFLKNFFENVACVQFNHRNAAYITYLTAAYTTYLAHKSNVPRQVRFAAYLMFLAVNYQVLNGVLTLLEQVPVHSASIHQCNALNVLSTTLLLLHFSRKPSKLYGKYLKQFI